MLNKDYLTTEVERLFAILDAEELPEVHSFLANTMDSEGFVTASPYQIAAGLVGCDNRRYVPERLLRQEK